MTPQRQDGVVFSGLLHVLLMLLAIFGLPLLFQKERDTDPMVITVELLPITGVTNVKPMDKPPAPETKPEEKKPEESKKPTPPVRTSTPTPLPPPPPKLSEKPAEKKPEPPKPEQEKKEEKKQPPKEEDLDAVLKAVRDTAKKTEETKSEAQDTSKTKNNSTNFDPNQMMSLSEKDAIRSQIAKNWLVPSGAKDAHDLLIMLEISIERDGTVTKVQLANESKDRYSRDSFFRAAADSAMRAVRQSSPLKDLPPDKFDAWHEVELTFDPKEMLF